MKINKDLLLIKYAYSKLFIIKLTICNLVYFNNHELSNTFLKQGSVKAEC